MHYIGIDYHKKYSYIVVKDREGTVEQRGYGKQQEGGGPEVC